MLIWLKRVSEDGGEVHVRTDKAILTYWAQWKETNKGKIINNPEKGRMNDSFRQLGKDGNA